jgi:hypothetical protein
MTAHNYSPSVNKLFTFGDPTDFNESNGEWTNYLDLGFSQDDIPELIRLVEDDSLLGDDVTENEYYAHIHAWRVLGQLQAAEAVKPLIRLFKTMVDSDWVTDDLPTAFGLIGSAAIPALKDYMAQHASDESASSDIVPIALQRIAEQHPDARDNCIAVMIEQLSKYNENTVILNSFIIGELLDLNAVEAAPIMKAAHAAQRVDITVNGTWQDVKDELGIDPSVEVPGPEPVEKTVAESMESMRSLFHFFDPSSNTAETTDEFYIDAPDTEYAPPSKKRTKAQAQQKAKRKQEKQSRKRNRKK